MRPVPRLALPILLLSLPACGGRGGIRDPEAFARTQTRADTGCVWSPARQLLAGGRRPVYVEYPSAAPVAGGTLLLGSPSIVWGEPERVAPSHPTHRDSLFPAGVVLGPSGEVRQVPDPTGARSMIVTPRVAALDDGTALVVWANRPLGDTPSQLPPRSVWAGRYDGRRWLETQQLFADSSIDWNAFTSTSELVGARGAFSLVFAKSRPERFVLLRYEHGRWTTRELPIRGAYPRLAATQHALLLAYVAPVPSASFVDGLWMTESLDGGVTWSESRIVDRSHRIYHQDPVLRVVGERATLVWRAHGDAEVDSVMLADAPAGAPIDSPWTRRPSLHVPTLHVGLGGAVVPSSSGDVLHVAFETSEGIGVAAWAGGRWLVVHGDAFADAATPPTFVRLGDRLAVMWGAAHATPAGREPLTRMATLPSGCTPR